MLENFNKKLINQFDNLILSISGGIDSMVMLDYFLGLKKEYNLTLHIAHIDHKKRASSHSDAMFVKRIADENQIPFYLYELEDKNYDNFHDYAHEQRYDFLVNIAKQVHAQKIVLAHHLDDLAETVIMRLTRGSSFEGYFGILEKNEYKGVTIIRPLLNIDKQTIRTYQVKHHIEYQEDHSNNEDDYTRNRFRHHLMPLLEQENPKYLEKIKQFSNYQMMAYEMIDYYANQFIENLDLKEDIIQINIPQFKNLFEIIQIDVIKKIINKITNNSLELSYVNIVDIKSLFNQEKSSLNYEIKNQLYIEKSYDIMTFSTSKNKEDDFNLIINDFGIYHVNQLYEVHITQNPNKNYDYMYKLWYNNLDLVFPLAIRNRRFGDRLDIHIGTKKLKDFFIDKKVPINMRNQLPLIVDQFNEILFVPNLFSKKTEGNQSIYISIIKK